MIFKWLKKLQDFTQPDNVSSGIVGKIDVFRSRRISKSLSVTERGFTLTEALVMIFILTFLLIAFYSLYEWHSKIYRYQKSVVAVTEQARFSGQAMQDYVSQAYRVLDSINLGGQVYTSATTSLVLQLPSVDGDGDILAGVWDYVIFYQNGNQLFYLIDSGSGSARLPVNKLLSDSIESLQLVYDNADKSLVKKISIDINILQYAKDQAVRNRLQENLYLKNYY